MANCASFRFLGQQDLLAQEKKAGCNMSTFQSDGLRAKMIRIAMIFLTSFRSYLTQRLFED